MKYRFRLLPVFLILVFAAMGCAAPLATDDDPSSEEVSTVVALTFQAMTPAAEETSTPVPVDEGLLPHSLYSLAGDEAGVTQIFRLERDGVTRRQVTSEPQSVEYYSVSPVDGSVAYVSNNQLMLAGVDGSSRRLLVDGGPVDENNPFLSRISYPVFSPDGRTLAYGYQGLNFYTLSTAANERVLENQLDDLGNGMVIPKELYWPEKYSPDGSRLMITLGYYEGAEAAFYNPADKSLTRLEDAPGALICCNLALWSFDGARVYSANSAAGMFNPGLWEVDPASGAVSILLASNYDTSQFNLAKYPYLAPDGMLYFFFLESDTGEYSRTPMQLVRSAPDAVSGRTVLRKEAFDRMNEALWAPGASLVVVANATAEQMYQGGQAEIVYLDGRPNLVLAAFAREMRWGP